ncbi:MAG TPA: CheR family methyltransferase [Actinomycetota bacterium]|nr:CheR family methyltransferase [Actinomycetota bacterium]
MTDTDTSPEFEALLQYLKRSRGFDFTGYKRASLTRRIDKRMQIVGADSYLGYLDHLEVDPEEFTQLFNTILINVTGFFRDPPVWDFLSGEVLAKLVAVKGEVEPVRIWSAGCASGEEAYSLAMMTAEALGPDVTRERVKIYATDVDEEALNQARQARYTARQVEGVPPELLSRYFEGNGQGYVFSKDLRRSVIFGRHDLIQDAPISRIDLLVCRNTLMYLNSETQSHVLARFSFALREGGYLLLGKAEMLLAHANLFTSVDLKRRVFRKVPGATLRDRLLALADTSERQLAGIAPREERIHSAALNASAEAQVVVDAGGSLAVANRRARTLFNLGDDDVGRPFQDLEISYLPLELRSKIQQVYVERRPSPMYEAELPTKAGDIVHLEVQVIPLIDEQQLLLGAAVSFADVTRSRRYKEELEHANQGLEDAYAELQSTNEELETTNEELQSTVEELETTNEELQSTNEELETMNEEMQSTNEELQTINDELGIRTTELNQLNAFLESIWAGLGGAVAVLDPDLRVLVWNHGSENLWGVRQEEVQGQHFLNLDIGLPVDQIRPALRRAMNGPDNGSEQTVVQATNRRGRAIRCRVTCSPLVGDDKSVHGVIVIVVEEPEEEPAAR